VHGDEHRKDTDSGQRKSTACSVCEELSCWRALAWRVRPLFGMSWLNGTALA
jgi:hypothetical protein